MIAALGECIPVVRERGLMLDGVRRCFDAKVRPQDRFGLADASLVLPRPVSKTRRVSLVFPVCLAHRRADIDLAHGKRGLSGTGIVGPVAGREFEAEPASDIAVL